MRRFTVSRTIDASRELLFDYLSDVSNYGDFCDHYLADIRLERLDPRGEGAAISFCIKPPLRKLWGDLVLVELERPHKIAGRGRCGRVGRVELNAGYLLKTVGHGLTLVEYSFETRPQKPIDRLREAGLRSWLKLQCRRSLLRLADIVEARQPAAQAVRAAAG